MRDADRELVFAISAADCLVAPLVTCSAACAAEGPRWR
jgi:hypothetical protein